VKVRIRTAIETITADMLQTVWDELDYRVDVCTITKGAPVRYVTKTCSVVLLTLRQLIFYIYIYIYIYVYIYIYIYGAPILDVSRSHTTTQHSR
jgi:hypothetical protein